ncbi:hypothetical protein V8E51_006803 [Hyaloscypha variabilis]
MDNFHQELRGIRVVVDVDVQVRFSHECTHGYHPLQPALLLAQQPQPQLCRTTQSPPFPAPQQRIPNKRSHDNDSKGTRALKRPVYKEKSEREKQERIRKREARQRAAEAAALRREIKQFQREKDEFRHTKREFKQYRAALGLGVESSTSFAPATKAFNLNFNRFYAPTPLRENAYAHTARAITMSSSISGAAPMSGSSFSKPSVPSFPAYNRKAFVLQPSNAPHGTSVGNYTQGHLGHASEPTSRRETSLAYKFEKEDSPPYKIKEEAENF